MNKSIVLLFIVFCLGCTNNAGTEVHQSNRDEIIDVHKKVKEIEINDVLIGSQSRLYLIDDYLIISDHKSFDKLIHIFNKNNFKYLTSTAYKGEGPNEIAVMGHIGIDEINRVFFVSDHGKQCIFAYNLDSVLADSTYVPTEKIKLDERRFPSEYEYINDTLCFGRMIEPIGNSDFKPSVAKWNMKTGKVNSMKYEHPQIEKKRMLFAVSVEHGIYVECYNYHDLMTICNLNGDLKYNIYGPNWDNRKSNKISYYGKPVFCNDRIIVSYSGDDNHSGVNYPTKFLVFDINGDYLHTLETGYRISDFCYDKENNSIIMCLDDEIQFAYLLLD